MDGMDKSAESDSSEGSGSDSPIVIGGPKYGFDFVRMLNELARRDAKKNGGNGAPENPPNFWRYPSLHHFPDGSVLVYDDRKLWSADIGSQWKTVESGMGAENISKEKSVEQQQVEKMDEKQLIDGVSRMRNPSGYNAEANVEMEDECDEHSEIQQTVQGDGAIIRDQLCDKVADIELGKGQKGEQPQ